MIMKIWDEAYVFLGTGVEVTLPSKYAKDDLWFLLCEVI